jgi:hypothetical protein
MQIWGVYPAVSESVTEGETNVPTYNATMSSILAKVTQETVHMTDLLHPNVH